MNKQGLVKGAIVLGIAGGISKVLGGIYRIPLARLIGDEGIAIYQMAYPIYTSILAFATAGIPVAISILIARKETQGYTGDSRRIFRVSLIMLAILGLITTCFVFKAAPIIAQNILNEPRVCYPIMAVAPAIFLSSLMAVFRGYFQGYQSMTPTAVSQVAEQLFRVIAIMILAWLLFPRGLEFAVAGATFSAVIGGVIGLIILVYYYINFALRSGTTKPALVYSESSVIKLGKELLHLAIPISLGACILPVVQILDAIIVRQRLEVIHYSKIQATMLFGQLSGKAAVLVGLPTIFTIAIATSLVPAISEAMAKRDFRLLNKRINYGFRAGAIISFPCAAGLYILAYPICDLLYATPKAGIPLETLAISCIMIAAFQLSSAGLQGIGRPEIAMFSLIITSLFKIIFNYTLTSIPVLNIRGAALATVISFFIGSLLNINILKKMTGISYEGQRLFKIALATIIMAVVVKFSFLFLLSLNVHSHIATLIAIIIGICVYGIQLLAFGEFSLEIFKLN